MNPSDKGRIVFEENRMSIKKLWTITLFLYFLLFALIGISALKYDMVSVVKMYLEIFFITSPLLIPVILYRAPLILYETGFYAPYNTIHLIVSKKKFIRFKDIKHITPHYRRYLFKDTWLEVITKNGGYIPIPSAKDRSGILVKTVLEKKFGDRWKEIYSELPILKENKMKSLEKKLLKPDSRVFFEALLVMISPSFLVLAGYIAQSIVLKVLGILLFFFSVLFGIMMIAEHYSLISIARETYNKIPKEHPMYPFFSELSKKRPEMKKKEFLMGNPVEEAKKFTEEDWKRLAKIIERNPSKNLVEEVIFIGLMATFVFGCFLLYLDTLALLFAILFFSIALLALENNEKQKAIRFLNEIIDEELRKKERIIPDWFRIENAVFKGIKFRERPRYSEEDWTELFKHWRIGTQKIAIFVFMAFFLVFLIGTAGALNSSLRLCPFTSSILLGLFLFGLEILKKYSHAGIVHLVLEYESQTGERVLPEKYRETAYLWMRKAGKSIPQGTEILK